MERRTRMKTEKKEKKIMQHKLKTHLTLHMIAEKQMAKNQLVLGEFLPRDDNGQWPLNFVV